MSASSEVQPPLLSDVTLIAASSVALGATIDALEASMRQCRFAKAILLTDRPISLKGSSEIECRKIRQLRSRADYSRFMLRELATHILTSHALCIQWDGFVLNGAAWDGHFLDFDYIGAVWPHFDDPYNVGNGGFSLRSRRLLEACRDLPFDGSSAEDVVIGRLCRRQLEQSGLRFAPETVASKFAYERASPAGDEFGFHGVYNFVRQIPVTDAERVLTSIEPNMLTKAERRELFRWALANKHYRLALHLLARSLKLVE
jgi:hypothetical protein